MKLGPRITPRWVEIEGARFRITPMRSQDRLELVLQTEKRGDSYVYPAAAQLQAIHACLLAWEGITDEDDEPAEMTPANIGRLDEIVLLRLFSEIQQDASLQNAEKPEDSEPGNSESQSK